MVGSLRRHRCGHALCALHHLPQPARDDRVHVQRNSPIADDGGGKYYATFFFVNGPYNPNIDNVDQRRNAPSTTQFCRQCHFGESNEANNTNNITTRLPVRLGMMSKGGENYSPPFFRKFLRS